MTRPTDFELLSLATPYALHAVTESERADIDQRVAAASPEVAEAFHEEVRAVRETMAVVSATTAVEPAPGLRDRVLAAIDSQSPRRFHWRTAVFAAAAAIVIAIAGIGVGLMLRPAQSPQTAEQIFSASDVRTVSGAIPSGGTATAVYSREKNAAVLVMNNVDPPAADTVYQMWLLDGQKPRSAGTMNAQAVGPSTTAVVHDLGHSSALAFTVEPGSGSEQPTGRLFAKLPLA